MVNQEEAAILTNAVWVCIEREAGAVHPVSWELLGQAVKLAVPLGAPVVAALLGHDLDDAIAPCFTHGAQAVVVVDHPVLDRYRTYPYAQALSGLVKKYDPAILLLGATTIGRDLASPVATEIGTGLTADCTNLEIEPETGVLLQTRPAFGGNVMATIVCRDHRPQMATVRPRVFAAPEPVPGRSGLVVRESVALDEEAMPTRVLEFIPDAAADEVYIDQAEVLVCAGRGLGGAENLSIVKELAGLLGGQVGGSRPVVEMGWLPASRQVGQTGKTVRPRVYIAAGISGAVQHIVGMKDSDTIIAVNEDADAPIFKTATYGVVGNALTVLPAVIEEIEKRRRPVAVGGGAPARTAGQDGEGAHEK